MVKVSAHSMRGLHAAPSRLNGVVPARGCKDARSRLDVGHA